MFAKVFIALMILSGTAHAALGKMPTQEQLDRLCVPVRLSTDGDIHWFYWKNISSFDSDGLKVKYGRYLDRVNTINLEEIENFEEAKARYEAIKGSNT